MNLEDLRAAQTRERATDGLQELRDSFYADVAEYIQELKERRDAAAGEAADPFGDPEVQELTDKIETAEQVAEAIYERRMGKLVKQASLAAAGMPDDEDGLTAEERDLYDDLVERIEANKAHVLDVISGDAEATLGSDLDGSPVGDDGEDAGSDYDPAADAADSSAAAAMGGGLDEDNEADAGDAVGGADDGAPGDEPADVIAEDLADAHGEESEDEGDDAMTDGDGDVDRMTVRVTDDVGEILGVDERPYTLEPEDVVTLPEENAAPLVEKDAAEKID